MGGRLYRTKTLASGGDCCDFYICKKDSRWDMECRIAKSAMPDVPFRIGFTNGLMSESMILWFGMMLIWVVRHLKEGKKEDIW